MATTPQQVQQAADALKAVQGVDAKVLARTGELTGALNLNALVPPVERLVNLFKQLPVATLADLPPNYLETVKQNAEQALGTFKPIQNYNIEQGNLAQFRQETLTNLDNAYNATWGALAGVISYSAARSADFQRLEREGREAVEKITNRSNALLNELEGVKKQADEALVAARTAAAEQGVSQQAAYFREEAAAHAEAARHWRWGTIAVAVLLALYAIGTIAAYNAGYLKAADSYESAQLITGKILLFAVISYMLLLSARNFLSHTHNAIVNKHRQNALLTFNALVAAAKDPAGKDVILTHAAACIFAPQETGYAKTSASQDTSIAQAMAGLLAIKTEGKP